MGFRGSLGRGLAAIPFLVAVEASAFEDSFSGTQTIEEAPSAAASSSAAWWLDSGGRLHIENGRAATIQGDLPPSDRWHQAYARSNPRDTDGGAHPQNLLRLLTQETGSSFRQRVSVRIRATHLSESPERDAFSGVFLWSRYRDPGDDLYVAGVRFDGRAVIKKKLGGVYHTLAVRAVYPGVYDRRTSPNLLPHKRWFSMRLSTEDVGGGVRLVLELHDPALAPSWIPLLEVIDGPGGGDGPPLTEPGRAGVRGDYMDLVLDEFLAFLPAHLVSERPGIRDDASGHIAVEAAPTPLAPPHRWAFGLPLAGEIPVVGRFSGASCGDAVGVYRPGPSTFHLRFTNDAGPADAAFAFGAPGRGMVPVTGDWDGDGFDGIGLYDPASSVFLLADRPRAGAADVAFAYGPPGAGWQPIAGDWNGDGRDTVGLYDPVSSTFFLRNALGAGHADVAFAYGPPGRRARAVAGDWDGDGTDTVGLFLPDASAFALRNRHAGGAADRMSGVPAAAANPWPIAGRWEPTCRQP